MRLGDFTSKITRMITNIRLRTLVKAGLTLGHNVYVDHTVSFDSSFCWLISIGDDSTLSRNVVILAHDASTKKFINFTKIGRVQIGKKTFIGACSVILPGVKIGDNVVIGAGSVVTNDIPDNCIAVGNPARVIKSINDYVNQEEANLRMWKANSKKNSIFRRNVEKSQKIMNVNLSNEIGYVE